MYLRNYSTLTNEIPYLKCHIIILTHACHKTPHRPFYCAAPTSVHQHSFRTTAPLQKCKMNIVQQPPKFKTNELPPYRHQPHSNPPKQKNKYQ